MDSEETKNELQPHHVQTVILDLLKEDKRSLAWQLIDHYFKKAFKLEHYDVLGYCSLKAEKRDTYLKCAEYSYALAETSQQKYISRVNLCKAYNALNMPEKALFYVQQNLLINPDDFEMQCYYAFNISLMGEKLKAEKMLLELFQKHPDKITKQEHAFAGMYLRNGNTAKGILSFVEAFKPKNNLFEKTLNMKRWNGVIDPGETLYVDIEGGIGDQIINIRFFDKLKSFGMNPILVSQNTNYYKHINQIIRRHGYNILTDKLLIDKNKKWIPMMSIPGYLGLTENDLWNGSYLTPLKNSKNILPGNKKKIGIKCSGNPYFAQDEYRKIPLNEILKILPEDAEVYYIDVEHKETDDPRLINLASKINSWEDTLDFIDQMDCIVSSCTSLVHAAGAMGKTTFVAVPIAEYYIWTTTKTDGSSPWYGENFYVAKQTKVRDWSEPLNDIGNRVRKFLELS
jgi:tetratricopeptide (TPR) repeat protein